MTFSLTLVLAVAAATDQSALAAEIVGYARSKLGEKVGGGQCSELVFEALQAAGADPFDRSRARTDLADARPGDVLQFRGVEFRGRSRRGRGTQSYWYRFEEHAAIVASVRHTDTKLLITVLHQNVGLEKSTPEQRERVTEQVLDLSDRLGGELTAYRPRPNPSATLRRLRPPDDADDRAGQEERE